VVPRIKADLAALLARDGFRSVGEAVGVDAWGVKGGVQKKK
jgi:hypothetical protein